MTEGLNYFRLDERRRRGENPETVSPIHRQKRDRVSVINSEGPPVPIPNTEVKLVCADNTWLEAARNDRSMLTQLPAPRKGRGFCFDRDGLTKEEERGILGVRSPAEAVFGEKQNHR